MKTEKNKITLALTALTLSLLLTGSLIYLGSLFQQKNLSFSGSSDLNFGNAKSPFEVHATITIYKNGVKISEAYHAGKVTNLGLNFTYAKILGNSTFYNMTQYNLNATYISVGYNTTNLTPDLTNIPNEWNRTLATPHDATYNSCNWTAVIHPGTGPYTFQAMGVNFEDGIGNNALLFYDNNPNQVTGIDQTFTINVEMKLSSAS